ncbi:MAG: hypothetical protein A2511_10360 [Deltaproteobacteria bacterium RIFOXYD12_FULL_50_9]|nr:MAG: hypothetical protein A2511_10360 [Deltaproteobacteria bacterium RIFOXYD12_FULL_50_9]
MSQIWLAAPEDKNRWDDFVGNHPEATPYHLFSWKEAVEKAYRHKSQYLLAEENGIIAGILPMFFMRLPFVHTQLVSLPFCDVGGILAKDEETEKLLLTSAIKIAEKSKAGSIEFRTRRQALLPAVKELTMSCRADKVSMFLPLPGSSEALWESFKSKLRSQVRKAEKNNLVFKWGEKSDRKTFYEVFSRNMLELGSPVHSRKFIDAVLESYGPRARMGLVYSEKKAIGAGIILALGQQVCIPWASTLRQYNNLAPNMFLYWHFLQYAADAGAYWFDFGRSTLGEGTFKFKAQWGAEPRQLYWHRLDFTGRQRSNQQPSAGSNGARERVAALWSRLPLPVANAIGPILRRHISL